MSYLPPIPQEMLKTTCQMGKGSACCRFIVADASGICCAKHNAELVDQITRRVEAGAFVARGDNCEGLQ